jgi:hypothetical protein
MRRCRLTVFGAVLFALALAGCATVSPFNQDFLEFQTTHFDVVSSLGEDTTRDLARRLENFYAAAQVVLGVSLEGRGLERTRVVAFDGRSLDRPFAVRGKTAYFLSEPDHGSRIIRAAFFIPPLSTLLTSQLRMRQIGSVTGSGRSIWDRVVHDGIVLAAAQAAGGAVGQALYVPGLPGHDGDLPAGLGRRQIHDGGWRA